MNQLIFNTFQRDEIIPVGNFIKNKKLAKYYNRETMSALVSIGSLLANKTLDIYTPVFYSTGILEHEEYELDKIAINSTDEDGEFSSKLFIDKALAAISPLTQFKVLYNMTLCFVSIEHGLKGDNAAIYSSASALLTNALYSNAKHEIIIGAGKVYQNGSVETGFAIVTKDEIKNSPFLNSDTDAIEIFRS